MELQATRGNGEGSARASRTARKSALKTGRSPEGAKSEAPASPNLAPSPKTVEQRTPRPPLLRADTFEELARMATPIIYRAARGIPACDRDDFVNEVLIALWKRWPWFTYRPDWLIRKKCSDVRNAYWRGRNTKKRKLQVPMPHEQLEALCRDAGVSEKRMQAEQLLLLLPTRFQVVLAARYFESCTFEEIGAMVQLSKTRAKQLHDEAIEILRLKLKRGKR